MSESVIKTTDLTKYYGSKAVVDHLNIDIPRGCICGFLGRNEAGKTTTIKMLLGLVHPTAGSAQVLGCDCAALTPGIRQRVGYVTEGHRLFRWMSIRRLETFQRAFFPHQWDSGFFSEMIDYFELLCVGVTEAEVTAWAHSQTGDTCLVMPLSMEDQFIEFTEPVKRTPLFHWKEKTA